jgi:tripartite-type tricarboxylate transporter receptor subunit TctC
MQRRTLLATATTLALATLATTAQAQDIPKKTLTLMVGFAVGGAADTVARLVAKKLADNLGQTVTVDNRGGAGGNIAHQLVARGEADGSLILLGSVGPLAIAPHLTKLPYDPQKDLAPLTMGVVFPNVLVVNSTLGIKNLADYVAYAKKHPRKLDYASTGPGSASHLAGELFDQRAGIETVHVPYKGGAPAMVDLVGGRVAAYFSTTNTAQPHIDAGKLIPLATTGLTRPSYQAKVPTIAEAGYPGFEAVNWYAFVASAKMPAAVQQRWNQELVKALSAPDVQAELLRHGMTAQPGSRDELARTIAAESKKWGQLISERKITGE